MGTKGVAALWGASVCPLREPGEDQVDVVLCPHAGVVALGPSRRTSQGQWRSARRRRWTERTETTRLEILLSLSCAMSSSTLNEVGRSFLLPSWNAWQPDQRCRAATR